MIAGSFVWIKGLRGPEPQKWPADMSGIASSKHTVLAEHVLGPDEFSLTVPILEQRYPAPTPKEES